MAEQCGPGPIRLPEVRQDPNCNEGNFWESLVPNVICRRSYVESILKVMSREGCANDDGFEFLIENCLGADFCADLADAYTLHEEALENCGDTSTCNPLCMRSLNRLSEGAGCCINSQFNSTTEPQMEFLSFEFWSRCGLTPPGTCEPTLNTDPMAVNEDSPVLSANNAPTLRAKWIITSMATVAVFVMIKSFGQN